MFKANVTLEALFESYHERCDPCPDGGHDRGADILEVEDILGVHDIGADEYVDVLFSDSFEGEGLLIR